MIKKIWLIGAIMVLIIIAVAIYILTIPPAELSIGHVSIASSLLNSSTFSGTVISTYNLTFEIPLNNSGRRDALNFTTSIRMVGIEVIKVTTEKLSSGNSTTLRVELSNFTVSNLGQAFFGAPNPSYTVTIYVDSTNVVKEINDTNNAVQLQFNL